MKHCEKCNLDFPDHFRFCGACGGPLVQTRTCSKCGELTESKWPFCTSCGSQLSSDAHEDSVAPTSELRESQIDSPATGQSERLQYARDISRKTSSRYSEPGELYAADLYQGTTSADSREIELLSDLDNSETAEIVRGSENVGSVHTYQPRPAELQPQVTIAAPAPEMKAAPTLSMMETYGRTDETPAQFSWWHGAILALIVLLFAGGVGLGGWYWWSHQRSPVQAAAQSPAPNQGALSEAPSTSPSPKPSRTIEPAPNVSADEAFRSLQNKRTTVQPSDNSKLAASYAEAEKKYPNDYRFPYERAKLSIVGVTSHHEAFGALALAAERAIDNGQAQEMLNGLNGDKDEDFYKLSRGHREWQIVEEALRNKDKTSLKPLRH